ncbi:unnamed protein product [Gulo gulo]|uniref:Uncharacterized protein n=1 Tax=Gulo gulo TaxID=48420 RepID=A0A9X9LBV6_GULGU|nr:unnamed protein product [Gulo gulo]
MSLDAMSCSWPRAVACVALAGACSGGRGAEQGGRSASSRLPHTGAEGGPAWPHACFLNSSFYHSITFLHHLR